MHTHTHKHTHFSSPISVQIERTIEALHLRYFVSETKINMHKHFYTFHKKSRSVASYAIGEGGGMSATMIHVLVLVTNRRAACQRHAGIEA